MTTSDLQTSQQQARGLGLALRREAGVRRGLEGALAAVHYEVCMLCRKHMHVHYLQVHASVSIRLYWLLA